MLLQNLQFDGSDCQNYTHAGKVKQIEEILNVLRELKKYYNSYFESWVCDEVEMIHMGILMDENLTENWE